MSNSSAIRAAIACSLFVLIACSDETTAPIAAPEGPTPAAIPVIEVGQVVAGIITADDRVCRFYDDFEHWVGLCDRFDITVPAGDTLGAVLRWSANVPLALFLKTSDTEGIELSCCETPIFVQVSAEDRTTYRIEVVYVGRPRGYPMVEPITYTLETALKRRE